ncbi:MAG: SDR family NAD(P)-dependent oxidoreductase [Polyangiales bacterium]
MNTESKTAIVTGANAGIGYASALQLAERGLTVVMACRNQARGEHARAKIVEATSNPRVHLLSLDTSSMSSVRAFAADFSARFQRLDVLINNAGNFDLSQKTPKLTSEGFEAIWATNYLGPWLLTRLLLPLLQQSAPSRVINVGSKGLLVYPFLRIEFDNLDGSKRYSPQRAYYHSKLALLTYTLDLARRLEGTGVLANLVRVPAVQVALDRLPPMPAWKLSVYKMKRRRSLAPEAMASAYTALALDSAWDSATGHVVDENVRSVGSSKCSRDADTAAELWRVSAESLGEGA